MKKLVSLIFASFLLQPFIYSEESIINVIEDYSQSKLTRIICESDKSIQETLIRPLDGKSQKDSRVSDKLIFRLALNDDFLLYKHDGTDKWLLLYANYDEKLRNAHKERNNKPGDEAELTFGAESIYYMLKRKMSDTEVIGPITLKITDSTREWKVDRTTGYFSHFTQETNLSYDQNGRYLGDGLNMINSEGYCSVEKEKKF